MAHRVRFIRLPANSARFSPLLSVQTRGGRAALFWHPGPDEIHNPHAGHPFFPPGDVVHIISIEA